MEKSNRDCLKTRQSRFFKGRAKYLQLLICEFVLVSLLLEEKASRNEADEASEDNERYLIRQPPASLF